MKILIINNHSRHTEKIIEIVKNINKEFGLCDIEHFKDITNIDEYTGIILTGGSKYYLNDIIFKPVINLITNSNIPILGICLGFELICFTYNCKYTITKDLDRGFGLINLSECNLFPRNTNNINAYYAHKLHIQEINPTYLDIIARREDYIYGVKVKGRNIYGLQFHPEMINEIYDNRDILDKFIQIYCK